MYNDKEYHKKYYADNYEKLKEYHRRYYQTHKEYFKESNKKWLATKRKAPLKCIICGGDLPDTKHTFKYCDKCVNEGKTSRQVKHLRKGVKMFDKLYGKRINFSNKIIIKKNCYSCDWSKQEKDEDDFSETLMCYCQPTTIACYTRHCRGCMYYKVDKEVNKLYDNYELEEEE